MLLPPMLLRMKYEDAAQAYLRSLPLEHFMESIEQSTQRKISVASFDQVQLHRPDIQTFSELLIQYPLADDRIGQVVPDGMTIVSNEPINVDGSFIIPLQKVRPILVMEYISKSNRRKDTETNRTKFEVFVKALYYLMFSPEAQELILYKLGKKKKYVTVKPNEHGRYPIPELELEVGILDGWMRFWFRGELLPLTTDLLKDLTRVRQMLQAETQRANDLSLIHI